MHTSRNTRIAVPIPAIAVMGALLIGQAIYLGSTSMHGTEANAYKNIVAPCVEGPQLRLVFKVDAKNVDVVLLGIHTMESVQYHPRNARSAIR